jgi:hypothetical protein
MSDPPSATSVALAPSDPSQDGSARVLEGSEAGVGETTVVGLKPLLPPPLCFLKWWTRPVPAERLAALRIGLAAVLLLDVLFTYWPHRRDFFGGDSLGSPEVFSYLFQWNSWAVANDLDDLPADIAERNPFQQTLAQYWQWSLLKDVRDPGLIQAAMLAWIAGIVCLLLGLCTRSAAAVVWLLSTSFASINSYIDNAGDEIRYIILFYLMLTPCGAAWSVDAWLGRRYGTDFRRWIGSLTVFVWFGLATLLVLQLVPVQRALVAFLPGAFGGACVLAVWAWWAPTPLRGRVRVYPWALRLLFVQMMLIYFCNGLYKASGIDWHKGNSLYYVLGDITLTRWSFAQFHLPFWLTKFLTYSVLVWEVGFPFLVIVPWVLANLLDRMGKRRPVVVVTGLRLIVVLTLCFGVAFHLGIGLSMELGCFVPYALCLYLPLVPWERWGQRSIARELRLSPAVT